MWKVGAGLIALSSVLLSSAAWAQSLPFAGVNVVVANNAGGNSDYMPTAVAEWEKATGGSVSVEPIPFADIKEKILTALGSDTFIADLLVVPSGLAGDLIAGGYVMPVPEASIEKLDYNDLFPGYRKNLGWDGVTYAWPWDGDVFTLNYRADLLDNEENKAAFLKEYGYELAVPATWKQYADVATFFSGTNRGVQYGWAEVGGRGSGSFHAFSARAVAYAKSAGDPAFYFDPKTMDARIANPGFVKALEEWKAALPSAIPSVTTLGAFETHMAFITGQVAMNVDWTDTGVMANDPSMSTIVGSSASAILPGSTEVYDAAAEKWETLEKPNQPGYAAFGGWIVFIPKNSRNPEAAISLADHLGSAAVMTQASQTPNAGVNPARVSTLDDTAGWVDRAGFKDEAHAANYLDSMRNSLLTDNLVYQLRIPGYSQYEEALELAVSEALTDQKTPEKALQDAAEAWNAITDRLGREKQLGYYRSDLGLPAEAK